MALPERFAEKCFDTNLQRQGRLQSSLSFCVSHCVSYGQRFVAVLVWKTKRDGGQAHCLLPCKFCRDKGECYSSRNAVKVECVSNVIDEQEVLPSVIFF